LTWGGREYGRRRGELEDVGGGGTPMVRRGVRVVGEEKESGERHFILRWGKRNMRRKEKAYWSIRFGKKGVQKHELRHAFP